MASGALIDNKDQKQDRLTKNSGQLLSRRAYNAVLGGVLAFGLVVNALMAYFLPESSFDIMREYPWAVLIGFLSLSFGSIAVIYKSDNPLVSFLGFFVLSLAFGYLVAAIVSLYSTAIVVRAFMLTATIAIAMMLMGTAFPKVFEKMGFALLAVLIIALIAEIVTMLVTHTDPIIFDYIFVIVFSLYIGYDWQKAQAYPPTLDNAVDSAADIYVDIINLFIRILSILGRSRN